MSSVNVCETEQ